MSLDVMLRIEELPIEIQEHIYRYHVKSNSINEDLKNEIHDFKLYRAFRSVISLLGVRNASWGFLYHLLTHNKDQSIRYRYVNYEPLVFEIWNSLTHDERDKVPDVIDIHRAYFTDDGLLEVDFSSVIS
jgi:hypothetical protein